MARRRPAFTLVELQVVIGIIALLIGILLPALGKARQSANKAACLSNLHSIGISIAGYVGTYKGSLPEGVLPKNTNITSIGQIAVNWVSLLAQQMGNHSQNMNGIGAADTDKRLGVFLCKDAVPNPAGVPLSHYSCHPLLMPDMDKTLGYPTGFPQAALVGQQRRPYRITHIPNPVEIVLIFDGTQMTNGGGEAGQPGKNLDCNRISGVDKAPVGLPGITYLIAGYNNVDLGTSVDGGVNMDGPPASTTMTSAGVTRTTRWPTFSTSTVTPGACATTRGTRRTCSDATSTCRRLDSRRPGAALAD